MKWDVDLFYAINGLAERSVALDWAMLALTRPSYLVLPGALLLIYWLRVNRRECLIGVTILAGLIVVTDAFGAQIKHLVHRPRPCVALQEIHQLVGCGGTSGFPSNHAANTAATAAFVHVLYPKTGWVSWPLVVVIGFARVYVGAHYMTDVVGGWMIGGLFGVSAAWLLLRWPRFRGGAAVGEGQPFKPAGSL